MENGLVRCSFVGRAACSLMRGQKRYSSLAHGFLLWIWVEGVKFWIWWRCNGECWLWKKGDSLAAVELRWNCTLHMMRVEVKISTKMTCWFCHHAGIIVDDARDLFISFILHLSFAPMFMVSSTHPCCSVVTTQAWWQQRQLQNSHLCCRWSTVKRVGQEVRGQIATW